MIVDNISRDNKLICDNCPAADGFHAHQMVDCKGFDPLKSEFLQPFYGMQYNHQHSRESCSKCF